MTCWNRLTATSLLWSLFTILLDYWLPIVGVMMRTNLDYSCSVFWNDEAKPTIFLLTCLASYLFKLMWRLPFFKSHGPPNKKPMTRHEKPPFQLLVRGAQETPKTTWVFAGALGCLPEVKGESLLLKTSHSRTQDSGGLSWIWLKNLSEVQLL